MIYEKKSSVWQNFVRSDKISNSVRPMSDKTPEYFDSTVLVTQYWNFLSPSGIILPKIIWPDTNSNSTIQPVYPLDTSIYGISIQNVNL